MWIEVDLPASSLPIAAPVTASRAVGVYRSHVLPIAVRPSTPAQSSTTASTVSREGPAIAAACPSRNPGAARAVMRPAASRGSAHLARREAAIRQVALAGRVQRLQLARSSQRVEVIS
jgi:hypothetical protein